MKLLAWLLMLTITNPVADELLWFVNESRTPELRTLREFAEQEIVIPDGPFEGLLFRCERQPYTGLLFDEIDSGRWREYTITGPVQSGKTLCAFIAPALWHVFEVQETLIVGIPTSEMASDKWLEDFKPVIERTRYARLLPTLGAGSKGGGKLEAVRFKNDVTLKFMTGGGGDQQRAGFTSRVLSVTETDKFDGRAGGSEEADKLTQLKGRLRAHDYERRRIYKECTVTTERGSTWRGYLAGSASRIMTPCPHCEQFVQLEREHLVGWQSAESEEQARNESRFYCSACGQAWSDADQRAANLASVLIHRGQTIRRDGTIEGDPPDTRHLGFRWSAINNLFLTAADHGADEWKAAQLDEDTEERDNAERELCQYVWSTPYAPPVTDETPLTPAAIEKRGADDLLTAGLLPADTTHAVLTFDLGKRLLHWMGLAARANGQLHVFEYGVLDILSDQFDLVHATELALKEFDETIVQPGFAIAGGGERRAVDAVWGDSNYEKSQDAVYAWSQRNGHGFKNRCLPTIGRGHNQVTKKYTAPKKTSPTVKLIGHHWHVERLAKLLGGKPVFRVQIHSDFYKSWLHQRLATPDDRPGALRLYHSPDRARHKKLSYHFTAEKQTREFVPGDGWVTEWKQIRKQNHWLDCGYIGCAALNRAGFKLIAAPPPDDTVRTSWFSKG